MDWLTFISTMVAALAWPVTVVVLILLLRGPLSHLIPLLQKLKYKDFELTFGRRVEEIKAEAELELPGPAIPEAPEAAGRDRLLELARISPRSAVLDAWIEVESAARDVLVRNDVPLASRESANPMNTIRGLQRAELVDRRQADIFHELRQLRNEAAHAPDFALSPDAAIEYGHVARRLAEHLRSIGRDGAA